MIYNIAIKVHKEKRCLPRCSRPIYKSYLNFLSKKVLSKELKVYGDGYFIIWVFYSSLYVEEKIETYVFDFDSAIVAVGGSLGLFLGWSCNSLILDFIEILYYRFKVRSSSRPLVSKEL